MLEIISLSEKLSNLSVPALLLVLILGMIYGMKTVIPKIISHFQDSLNTALRSFREELATARTDHRVNLDLIIGEWQHTRSRIEIKVDDGLKTLNHIHHMVSHSR